jgi:histone deacetylase 11
MPRVVYSPHYNIGFLGIERLHPFDARKYGRAWKHLKQHFGRRLKDFHVAPQAPADRETLLTVHMADYLDSLRQPDVIARTLEFGILRWLPWWLSDWIVLAPMRWATQGTIVAAREALQDGFAVNLGGGFHHAKPNRGEGFCVYNDIALAIRALRREGRLAEDSRIAYIDLDAHQGNGVCHCFLEDSSVFLFDMFNADVYPLSDYVARTRVDRAIPLHSNCTEREYLRDLREELPAFLDSISRSQPISLAIYNSGTDVFAGDNLGLLNLSAAGILDRDLFTVEELRRRGIPTMMLLSGGYTKASYRLSADSVIELMERESNGDNAEDVKS